MKKLIFIGIFLSCTTFLKADDYNYQELIFTGDTKNLLISTTPTQPTQILTLDPYCQKTWIIWPSSFTIHFSTVNATISTATAFGFGSNATSGSLPIQWSPDGPQSPWGGPMWAVSEGVTPPTISVFRAK